MKRLAKSTLAAILFFVTTATVLGASDAQAEGKLRVLLTYGGHGFQQKPFFAVFDNMKDVEYTKAPMPASADLLKPGLEEKYDVIVMYDMVGSITPEQQKAFVALLNKGIGLVSLHHNMGAHRDWDEFRKITGGKFLFKPRTLDGQDCPKSGYAHGQDVKVTVADIEHPITRGVKDFVIHDETYNNYYTAGDVKVLLTTDHPKNDPELAWVKDYGKSRVFYLMLGHDAKAYTNENFAKILEQGIRWTAGK